MILVLLLSSKFRFRSHWVDRYAFYACVSVCLHLVHCTYLVGCLQAVRSISLRNYVPLLYIHWCWHDAADCIRRKIIFRLVLPEFVCYESMKTAVCVYFISDVQNFQMATEIVWRCSVDFVENAQQCRRGNWIKIDIHLISFRINELWISKSDFKWMKIWLRWRVVAAAAAAVRGLVWIFSARKSSATTARCTDNS